MDNQSSTVIRKTIKLCHVLVTSELIEYLNLSMEESMEEYNLYEVAVEFETDPEILNMTDSIRNTQMKYYEVAKVTMKGKK